MCIPRYHLVKISFCQSIALPKCHFTKIKYHFANDRFATVSFCQISFCQNIVMPSIKAEFCQISVGHYSICSQNHRPKSLQNNNLGHPQSPNFAQSLGVMVPLEPSSPVIATTGYPYIFQISILAWGDGCTGTIVLF